MANPTVIYGKYNKPSAILVLDLINRDNGTNVTFDDIILYDIKKNNDGDPIRDTRIECKAVEGSPYYGTQFFTYSRVDIGKYLEDYGTIRIPPTGQKKISDLLPNLNERFELALEAGDIIDEYLGDYEAPFAVMIIPRAHNFAWIGKLEVVISDEGFELGNVLVNNKLNGLTGGGVTNQFDLSAYSMSYDFSMAKDYLKTITIGDISNEDLADIFNGHVEQIWDVYPEKVKWNWKEGTVIYNSVVNKKYTPRKDITNVLVVDISNKWFLGGKKGYILMHYNN